MKNHPGVAGICLGQEWRTSCSTYGDTKRPEDTEQVAPKVRQQALFSIFHTPGGRREPARPPEFQSPVGCKEHRLIAIEHNIEHSQIDWLRVSYNSVQVP